MNSYRWIVRCHGRGPGFECAAFHLHFLCWYNRAREELFLLILKRHRQSSRSPYFNSSAPGDWSSKFSSSLLPAHLFSGWCSRCPYWFTFSEALRVEQRNGNSKPCRFEANLGGQICPTLPGSILAPIRKTRTGWKLILNLAESTDSLVDVNGRCRRQTSR